MLAGANCGLWWESTVVRPLSAKQDCLMETLLERGGVPWILDLQQANGLTQGPRGQRIVKRCSDHIGSER